MRKKISKEMKKALIKKNKSRHTKKLKILEGKFTGPKVEILRELVNYKIHQEILEIFKEDQKQDIKTDFLSESYEYEQFFDEIIKLCEER